MKDKILMKSRDPLFRKLILFYLFPFFAINCMYMVQSQTKEHLHYSVENILHLLYLLSLL